MSVPDSVTGRTVIVGGGVHAATFAATFAALGRETPLVLEANSQTGGIFRQLTAFRMNSTNFASRESINRGPSRIPSYSPSDDLNWIPNSVYQVSKEAGAVEYPDSSSMARVVTDTLDAYAEVYTGVKVGRRYGDDDDDRTNVRFDYDGDMYTNDDYDERYLGNAKRIIWAAGLAMPQTGPTCPAIMSAYNFLKRPVRQGLDNKRIAVYGDGDTAATVVEYMLGQGYSAPYTLPRSIHWYGSALPSTREAWYSERHARYSGIGRHLIQVLQEGEYDEDDDETTPEVLSSEGVIRIYRRRASVASLGNAAMVEGQVYDLAIDATGFTEVESPYETPYRVEVNGVTVAQTDEGKIFTMGAAANRLGGGYEPVRSRYGAASKAIYRIAPMTAMFAASLDS